jgi:hypothetical protein
VLVVHPLDLDVHSRKINHFMNNDRYFR